MINLRTLKPLDRDTIVNSVRKTHRLVTAEEGWPQSGVGAELVALVNEEARRGPSRLGRDGVLQAGGPVSLAGGARPHLACRHCSRLLGAPVGVLETVRCASRHTAVVRESPTRGHAPARPAPRRPLRTRHSTTWTRRRSA